MKFGVIDNDTVLYVSNSYAIKVQFQAENAIEFPIPACESARILDCSPTYALLSLDTNVFVLNHAVEITETIRTSNYSLGFRVFQCPHPTLTNTSLRDLRGHLWDPDDGRVRPVDLASMRHTDPTSGAVISSLAPLFELVRTSTGVVYGLCRLLDGTYTVIKVTGNLVTRITNHCGPTDICPFESTGNLLGLYRDKPVVRNAERIFVLEPMTTFATDDGMSVMITGTEHDKIVFMSRKGAWIWISPTGPKRSTLNRGESILAMTETRVIVRNPTAGVQERNLASVFDDAAATTTTSPSAEDRSKMRHFVVLCADRHCHVARVLETIRTRRVLNVVDIAKNVSVVSTSVRFDSFQLALNGAFGAMHGMVYVRDFVTIEFPSLETAEMFSRRLWTS